MAPETAASGDFETDAELTLFGFDSTPAPIRLTARTRAWRVGGAVRIFAIFLVLAPFAAIFPPHAVWPIGALAAGGLLARRRYIERFTLRESECLCPKCQKTLHLKPTRLRVPHPVACDDCHHESSLRLPEGVLEAHARG